MPPPRPFTLDDLFVDDSDDATPREVTDPRRVVYLDVDDTLNLYPYATDDHLVSFTARTGLREPFELTVTFDPSITDRLAALAADGVSIVWNTTWNDRADSELAARFGLPTGLRHLRHVSRVTGVHFGWSTKLTPVWEDIKKNDLYGARVVVLDDMLGGKDRIRAEELGFHVPDLNMDYGVTSAIMDEVELYLAND